MNKSSKEITDAIVTKAMAKIRNRAVTTEATEPLTEDTVQAIEAMVSRHHPDLRYPNFRRQLAAVIQDWRALRARIEALTTDWCECGHSRDKHQFFSDHDECYECDQASPDLCSEWRPAPRANENAVLREQLATAEKEQEPCRQVQKRGVHSSVTCACVIAMEKSQ